MQETRPGARLGAILDDRLGAKKGTSIGAWIVARIGDRVSAGARAKYKAKKGLSP
jgi:hypothetical protein